MEDVQTRTYVSVDMYVCLYICMYVCMHEWMHACLYVLYIYICVCVYVCRMCIYVYVHVLPKHHCKHGGGFTCVVSFVFRIGVMLWLAPNSSQAPGPTFLPLHAAAHETGVHKKWRGKRRICPKPQDFKALLGPTASLRCTRLPGLLLLRGLSKWTRSWGSSRRQTAEYTEGNLR